MFKDLAFIFKTPLRAKLVTFFVRRPGEWGSAVDAAAVVGGARKTVSRELSALAHFGILTSRRAQGVVRYSVNEQDELFTPLARFLSEAAMPSDKEILDAFRGIRGITLILAAGLLAHEEKSPAELFIVCKGEQSAPIGRAVRKLELFSGLPLRYAVLGADEYAERRQAFDRLTRDFFEYRHRVILEKDA